MVGKLRPLGVMTIGEIEEAEDLFRVGLKWTGDGTSSVACRGWSIPPFKPADGGEAGSCRSKEECSADNVLTGSLSGLVGDRNGDAALGVDTLPSTSRPEAVLLWKLPALERCSRSAGVTFHCSLI